MKLQYFVISFLIITAIVIGTTNLIGDLQINTGTQVNASYNNTYNLMNESLQIANETSGQLQGSSISSTAFQAGLLSGFPILRIVGNGYSILVELINNISDDLNLPNWVVPLVLGIISIMVTFALVNALFARDT